jgi:hypothetical protein
LFPKRQQLKGTLRMTEFEANVLRHLSGVVVPELIWGAMDEAVEWLHNKGYVAHVMSDKAIHYVVTVQGPEALRPWQGGVIDLQKSERSQGGDGKAMTSPATIPRARSPDCLLESCQSVPAIAVFQNGLGWSPWFPALGHGEFPRISQEILRKSSRKPDLAFRRH